MGSDSFFKSKKHRSFVRFVPGAIYLTMNASPDERRVLTDHGDGTFGIMYVSSRRYQPGHFVLWRVPKPEVIEYMKTRNYVLESEIDPLEGREIEIDGKKYKLRRA